MANPLWLNAALIFALAALALVAAQWIWQARSVRRQLGRRISQRLEDTRELPAEQGARYRPGRLDVLLLRANLRFSSRQVVVVGLLAGLALLLTGMARGPVVALVCAFFVASAGYVYWRVRFQKQRQKIYSELPEMIDAVLRYIEAGRSLEQALTDALADASPIFGPLNFRVRSAVEAGRDYTRLFEDFAELYRVAALVLVALALRTSARFGSSVKPLLRQVADALRSQQALRQEFLAATAETRFTAATFALLPPGLAVYMTAINEEYSAVLLDTATGHTMLAVAGALQLCGMLMIWRMIQGVGRD
ncbi:type II secretion protein F [Marinobacter halodurans]|uniref:Type II secretion protein F n=1 Tax=Marinobacter halodurans TaxID=2528979 RepID=A0ABY1ZGW5_9GAMM|nr:type II secretion system F family protein [Marinobacter halodurans]TBW51849.1 type II secretion protein F [Marinobacter halodurans]